MARVKFHRWCDVSLARLERVLDSRGIVFRGAVRCSSADNSPFNIRSRKASTRLAVCYPSLEREAEPAACNQEGECSALHNNRAAEGHGRIIELGCHSCATTLLPDSNSQNTRDESARWCADRHRTAVGGGAPGPQRSPKTGQCRAASGTLTPTEACRFS